MHATDELGLYVHIPFCAHKCPYCDFNTYAGLEGLMDAYVGALCRELEEAGRRIAGRRVQSVFIGGGTPTLLTPSLFGQVMTAVRAHFTLAPGAEITSEANPGSVDKGRFDALVDLGVNRLSLGAQSFVAEELAFLGRQHSAADVAQAYDAARRAGFANINLDLIFGLPDQTAPNLKRSLDALVALSPDHVSAYSLIVEPDTPLGHAVKIGRQKPPDDDDVAELYELVVDTLGTAGYLHYEVSNWARDRGSAASRTALAAQAAGSDPNPSQAARHNLVYWHNGEYLGVGPGAHSHLRVPDCLSAEPPLAKSPTLRSRRWANLKPVPAYIQHMNAGQTVEAFTETLDHPTAMAETMLLGLRLVREGVPRLRFRALHGIELSEVYRAEVAEMVNAGLLREDEERVTVTERGLRFHSHVAMAFMPDEPG